MLDLAALRAQAEAALTLGEKATPGPWGGAGGRVYALLPLGRGAQSICVQDIGEWHYGNRDFIADARTSLPALAGAVLALVAEVERLSRVCGDCEHREPPAWWCECVESGSFDSWRAATDRACDYFKAKEKAHAD